MDDNDADNAMLEQYIMKEVTVEVPTKEPIKNMGQNLVSEPEENLKETSVEEALKQFHHCRFLEQLQAQKQLKLKVFFVMVYHMC
ncbi:hypothetical protein CTI12_AA278370 [Artemisia annua]|uniref:Uncharacterized protein n=1 Tax=Artemisia annua TaxID=35608 RepID=A0A2U1NEB4_ARTAN|nr:hypothetical protein CTI12_AA278370 [Artemisia annua]